MSIIDRGINKAVRSIVGAYYRILPPNKSFSFQGRSYKYLYHPYAATWNSERKVEVPIIYGFVAEKEASEILEVGNVLHHYYPSPRHDVLDKYEKWGGVINADVETYRTSKRYSLIVSISTMEHVGYDEPNIPRDPEKILRSIENLKGMLAPGGKIIITMPPGFNPNVDAFIRNGRINFSEKYFLKRTSKNNDWKEAGWDEVKDAEYGSPFRDANAIIIGIIKGTSR